MLSPEDHRDLAERCVRLAKASSEPNVARYLMALAASYLELADFTPRHKQLLGHAASMPAPWPPAAILRRAK
jgi:hypothetical protein